ncbi:MAG TPA: protein phosphatase, partial [Bacillota bacterium]|nr:protein phosphatase [Bacillota bacterium]
DGLSDKITNDELALWLQKNTDHDEIGQQLIDLANERGGEDNISLIIVYNDLDGKEGESSC